MIANKIRLLGTTALLGGAGLALAACAGNSIDMPRAADITMAPRVIDPGQATVVSYRVPAGSANVARVELVGLPPNSVAAGTVSQLAIPAGPNDMSSTSVAVRAPAKDGVYPVSLRVTSKSGQVSDTPIGTLTVNNTPASIVAAQINPPSHNVVACAGQPVNVQLTYTVTDANGASDMRDPRLVQVRGASTVAVAAPVVLQSASVLPVAPSTTVVTNGATTYTIVNPSVQQQVVVAAPATPTSIVLPPGGVPLSAPTRADTVQETVTTPLTIACPIAAPAQWDWIVQASDDNAVNGQVISTNQAAAKYFTAQ